MQSLIRRLALLTLFCLTAAEAHAETRTGYVALDVANGQVLDGNAADDPFIPASVTKLPMALAILDRLGPDHRFQTRLAYTGTIADGVLTGDLFLVGGGDPMLDHEILQEMAKTLATQGITRIEGRFVYDGSALPHIPIINDRQPPDASYNPGIEGLALDHNRYLVDWVDGHPVGVQIPLDPLPAFIPDPTKGRTWMPVRAPAAFAARTFRWASMTIGLTLPEPVSGRVPPSARTLLTQESPTLTDILRPVLFFSNNVAMESLALSATQAATPHEAAATLVQDLALRTPGVDLTGLRLPNASGLDDSARMTPRQCAQFALEAARRVGGEDLLPPLLTEPFANSDKRYPSPSPLRAKTGTLAYARALSGIVETVRGRKVAFCVMTDDKVERSAYAALPFDARDDERPVYRSWRKNAKEQEKTLVLGWRERF